MGTKALLIGISLFEAGILYWLLCGTVLDRKYFQKKDWVILWANIVSLGVGQGINRSWVFFSQSMLILSVAVTCICVILINRQNKLLKIIISILYYVLVALADFFAAFVSMAVLKHEFMVTVYIYADSIMECILFLCVRIVITVCVYLVVKQNFDETYIHEFQSVLLFITISMCLMLRYYHIAIIRLMYEGREQEAGATGLSLMGVVLAILFIGMLYLKNKTLKKEKEFLIMRDAMVTQKFTELEEIMERNRHLSHDLKNHMLVLRNYEREGNYEGLHNYIEEIEDEFFETKKSVWTGNQIADMMLEQKRALAEQENITFTIQAVPIAEWPLDDNGTCSVLGNLLDNAIEACKKIADDKDKWISIKIENQKQFLFIKIENSVSGAPAMKNGRPVSMKHDKMRHGYGLKSVERIVNKYEGTIAYQSKDNIFQVEILF